MIALLLFSIFAACLSKIKFLNFRNSTFQNFGAISFNRTFCNSTNVKWRDSVWFDDGCVIRLDSVLNRQIICVIDEKNSFSISHMAHDAQSLFPCWSLFVRHNESEKVIFINDAPANHQMHFSSWGHSLISIMGARIIRKKSQLCGLAYGVTSFVSQGGAWFQGEHDAQLLRDRIIPSLNDGIPSSKKSDVDGTPKIIRIGFLNRKPSFGRSMTNIGSIEEHLSSYFANKRLHVIFSTGYFEESDFLFQVAWMASHEIIVSPHGNQLANLVFAAKCTAFIELFPPSYFLPHYFQTLSVDSGQVSFYLRTGFDPLPSTSAGRDIARKQQIQYGPLDFSEDRMDLILAARKNCLKS